MHSLAQPCAVNNTLFSLWEGQKLGFSLRIAHIAPSLCFCTKGIFSDACRGIECIWDLCACSCERQFAFFCFLGLIQALKSAALFSIAKFDKNSAKWNVFWCRNGIWGAFVLAPLHQNQHFFEGPTPPLSKLKFPPYRQNRRLYTQ